MRSADASRDGSGDSKSCVHQLPNRAIPPIVPWSYRTTAQRAAEFAASDCSNMLRQELAVRETALAQALSGFAKVQTSLASTEGTRHAVQSSAQEHRAERRSVQPDG